jgi:hypothetical protein
MRAKAKTFHAFSAVIKKYTNTKVKNPARTVRLRGYVLKKDASNPKLMPWLKVRINDRLFPMWIGRAFMEERIHSFVKKSSHAIPAMVIRDKTLL